MGIKIIKTGVFDTVQDLGRVGFRKLGINPGGAMDRTAVRLINLLLGNEESAAVIEMHFPAPSIEFTDNCRFAIGGADLLPTIGGERIPMWNAVTAAAGGHLKFEKRRFGSRCYLAVEGGIGVEDWLGSASTNLYAGVGGFNGRRLAKGDVLDILSPAVGESVTATETEKDLSLGFGIRPHYAEEPVLRITEGPEFHLLTALSANALLTEEFVIGPQSDRMGFRLEGQPLHLIGEYDMVSSAVDFGTIQLLPNGQMVLLMADHQTTGGYPRIAAVAGADLTVAAQAGPGTFVRFSAISTNESEELDIELERDLRFLRMGLRFRAYTS